jgi:hypothetical protein
MQGANSNASPRIKPTPTSTRDHINEVSEQLTRVQHYMFLKQHKQDHAPTEQDPRSAASRAHTIGSECGQRSSGSGFNGSCCRNMFSDVREEQNHVDDAVDLARAPKGVYRGFPLIPGLPNILSTPDVQHSGIAQISGNCCEETHIEAHDINIQNTGDYLEYEQKQTHKHPSLKTQESLGLSAVDLKLRKLLQLIFSTTRSPKVTVTTIGDSTQHPCGSTSRVVISGRDAALAASSEVASTPEPESRDMQRQFHALGLSEVTPLDHNCPEFKHLQHYFHQSQPGANEANDVLDSERTGPLIEDIFRIKRTSEEAGLPPVPMGNAQDARKLLWHGSRASNFEGIFTHGLRVAAPGKASHGNRWGNAIYLADESRKAWQYCHPEDSNETALLLLFETQIGHPVYEMEDEDTHAVASMYANGLLSVVYKCWEGWRWVDASAVNQELHGVMMPEPSAGRHTPGLKRFGRGHNEVGCHTSSSSSEVVEC